LSWKENFAPRSAYAIPANGFYGSLGHPTAQARTSSGPMAALRAQSSLASPSARWAPRGGDGTLYAVNPTGPLWERIASQEASGSSGDFTGDFGATLRQARVSAVSTMASLACASTTFVAPSRPQPPGTGTKALGAAFVSMACCSGVSWIMATEAAGHSKLANDLRVTRKSERPLRELSTAPG
jgi:hypothetical protein